MPIFLPLLEIFDVNPYFFAMLIALNLQTSFLTPPFGFSLFYLRGVADESIKTSEIYSGVFPFILIQLLVLLIVMIFPIFIL